MRFSSARKLVQFALDLIAPPSERAKRIRQINAEQIPQTDTRENPKKDFIEAVCDYRKEKIRDIVYAGKYDGSRHAGRLMGKILARELLQFCSEHRVFANKIVITSVPMTPQKQAQRGFNQSKRIAQAVEDFDTTNTTQYKQLLNKVRTTPAQSHLQKAEREKNVRGAFKLRDDTAVENKTVVVVDDVTTTGATLTEARRALKAGNPEKTLGFAFAH